MASTAALARKFGSCTKSGHPWPRSRQATRGEAVAGLVVGALVPQSGGQAVTRRAAAAPPRVDPARRLADARLRRRLPLHDRPAVDRPADEAGPGPARLAAPAADLGLHDGVLARLERRAEGDGHHHPRAGRVRRRRAHRHARLDAPDRRQDPDVGRVRLRRRDRPRHDGRRQADHQDDGLEDHPHLAAAGLRRRDRRHRDEPPRRAPRREARGPLRASGQPGMAPHGSAVPATTMPKGPCSAEGRNEATTEPSGANTKRSDGAAPLPSSKSPV